jgi:hypothetical protein
MAGGDPGNDRVIIEHAADMLRITIHAARQPAVMIFLVLWLGFWPLGEITAIRDLLGGKPDDDLFNMIFVLVFWTLGGVAVAYTLLWRLTGKEIIELTPRSLYYRKQMTGFGRSREYAVAHLRNLRPVTPVYEYHAEGGRTNGLENGAISFDYGRNTHRFGLGLEEADARQVIAEMCGRVTSLCGSGASPHGGH